MKIRWSQYSQYMLCPRKFYWTWVRNLVPKLEPLPLGFGAAIHEGLAAWFSDGDLESAIVKTQTRFDKDLPEDLLPDELKMHNEYRESLGRMLRAYASTYPTQPFELLQTEIEGEVPLGTHIYVFRCDGLLSWNKKVLLLERKTMAYNASQSRVMLKYVLDFQSTGYCWAVSKKLGMLPSGIVIDALVKERWDKNSRKLTGEPKFFRDVVFRLPEAYEDWERCMTFIADELQSKRDAEAAGGTKHLYPMNTGSCVSYGQCTYIPLCKRETPDSLALFKIRPPSYEDEPRDEE